jgi:2-oxoisovalerate dehydrogenase E1 component
MEKEKVMTAENQAMDFDSFRKNILEDFRIANISREASLLGRKEVLTGKAKFGIFGDGKELAQIAMAKQFKNGDFRSGYYRDQTFMLAIGQLTVQEFFAQLYAHTDLDADPASAGRQMNGHYATRSLNLDGSWKNISEQKNSSPDISPTAGQMPRLLGLAQASKIYRNVEELNTFTQFSKGGNEVAFGTIGDASTSEGLFWETFNAAGVLQVPMAISVWDDGYGISVPKKYQTTKESISTILKGFQREKGTNGYEIFKVDGWNYPELCETYEKAIHLCRTEHVPVLIHVENLTQPQGHSTSGSHERYKSKETLEWTKEYDCINQFKKWILAFEFNGEKLATAEELETIEKEAQKHVKNAKKAAWEAYLAPLNQEKKEVIALLEQLAAESSNGVFINKAKEALQNTPDAIRRDILGAAKKGLRYARGENNPAKLALIDWLRLANAANHDRYSSLLHSEFETSALSIKEVKPEYSADAEEVDGRIVLRDNFEKIFSTNPRTLVFGEDSGFLGDVNQALEGMQQKFGELRVSDTGIREATILGQGIGMALRGLRPIAEIQYLDYLLYALQIMSDDLATILYRTKGGQKAPVIIRTRGHRLEGIWHSGSPMGTIINSIRGIYVCVPRNMTQAAGFYNTLLEAEDDPALIIEPLNGYRTKELLPSNLGEFKTPLGVPEVVQEGTDITIVSYGATFNLCMETARQLQEVGISAELIDVRTLLPFDVNHIIADSIKKTNRLLVVDEDVPGGGTGFILDKILNEQNGYHYLDSKPVTLSAKDHRPAYASDGDYFSKPSTDDIFDAAYSIMNEANPEKFPSIY